MIPTWFEPANGLAHWIWRSSWQAALVAALVFLAQSIFRQRLSPKWSSALWLLVLIRLIWPFSIQSPASLYNVAPSQTVLIEPSVAKETPNASTEVSQSQSNANWPLRIWLAGATGFAAWVGLNWFRISRRIRRERPVTDSSLLDLLEDCKHEMRVFTPLTLVESREAESPALFGFIRPRLLLPIGLMPNFSREELRHIFLHELSHVKRADVPLNWFITALMAIHWFNPFLWFAFHRMRADRELACDAMALSFARENETSHYGETIIRLVEHFSRPTWGPGIVGIVEEKNQMQRRIRMIAKSRNAKRWPGLAAALFVTLGILTLTEAQSLKSAAEPGNAASGGAPRIIATSPKVGEKDVDPNLKEIIVTFDRDMAGGFSWTGGGPDFPKAREGSKPVWRDKRTCAFPISLEPAHYYRLGINSQSHQNFKSAVGTPARPTSLYFTTKGAGADLAQKTAKPQIVSMTPKNGATDVDPATTELRVTFNTPMARGFSWTGGGAQFPPTAGKPFWTEDKKTCVLPVQLKPGADYRIGMNSVSHQNFQSEAGVPLEPVVYTFKTK